jgi:hypothetical protein
MTKGQMEARKKIFLEKMRNGDTLPTYRVRQIRLKVEQFFIDPRKRIE